MLDNRPECLVGVLGTHTEVGKTYVSSEWLKTLSSRGLRVAARKPVQSFDPSEPITDAQRLAAATGESEFEVCADHRRYQRALAPPMAADLLRRPSIAMAELLEEIAWPASTDVGIVETVGGPNSPLAHDGDSVAFLQQIKPDSILLIANANLGAINAVRLSMNCLAEFQVVVYLNRFDAQNELHALNRRWLGEKDGFDVAVNIAQLDAKLLRMPILAQP